MPYINLTTAVSIPDTLAVSLKERLADAITLIRGKSEEWLMINLNGDAKMYFKGLDTPSAMLEIAIFGSASDGEYRALTAECCSIAGELLGISPDRVYVKYTEHDRWGWNGINF